MIYFKYIKYILYITKDLVISCMECCFFVITKQNDLHLFCRFKKFTVGPFKLVSKIGMSKLFGTHLHSSNKCSRIEIPINFNDDILWNCVFDRTICYIRSSMFTRCFRYCEGRGWAFRTNIFKAWCTTWVSSINDSNKNHKINSCIAYILAFTSNIISINIYYIGLCTKSLCFTSLCFRVVSLTFSKTHYVVPPSCSLRL